MRHDLCLIRAQRPDHLHGGPLIRRLLTHIKLRFSLRESSLTYNFTNKLYHTIIRLYLYYILVSEVKTN